MASAELTTDAGGEAEPKPMGSETEIAPLPLLLPMLAAVKPDINALAEEPPIADAQVRGRQQPKCAQWPRPNPPTNTTTLPNHTTTPPPPPPPPPAG
jgi:hypothetical protein